ncbi:MAG: hypothetical protein V3R25_05675 [Nitrosomonadaceae bacterium]
MDEQLITVAVIATAFVEFVRADELILLVSWALVGAWALKTYFREYTNV